MGQIAKAELIIFGFHDYRGYGTYSNLHCRNHLCKTQLAKGCTIDPHTLLICTIPRVCRFYTCLPQYI